MKNKFYLKDFTNYLKKNSLFTNIFVLMTFLISVIIILFFNYFIDAFFTFDIENYLVGQPAKKDYVLKSDFSYFNEFETKIAQDVVEQLVLPVYRIDNEITLEAISELKKFYETVQQLSKNERDPLLMEEVFNKYIPDLFTRDEIRQISKLDLSLFFSLLIFEQKKILNRGYISKSSISNGAGLINVISMNTNKIETENVSAISVLKSVDISVNIPLEFNPYFHKLLSSFLKVNCFYDQNQTKFNKNLALENVEPVIDKYRNGETLVKKNMVVSAEIYKKIQHAEILVKKNTLSNLLLVIGYVAVIYLSGFVLFSNSFIQRKLKESDVILLTSVTLFFIITATLLHYFMSKNYIYLYPLILPTMLISMLMTFLLGNKVGLYISILLSFFVLLISNFNIYDFLLTLGMSILSTIIVHDAEKRIDLLKSSGELALLQIIVVVFMLLIGLVESDNIPLFLIVSVTTSLLSGILTLALLPLSEHFLKISTAFQLAELCDLNTPLLKSMLIKAPGTYAHSIAVANMAESAAQHIGANALLAKAGGYYHDIGKIDQPHYFIENQKGGKNLHDDMKPTLSVAVIKSHVKLGIEKGKNIGLPGEIISIIEQHHGKGAIAYFLEKAKKENKSGLILTEDFGYSGPNPQSPEAAIVMLADSVEAAVRSLKSPTISQLEKFVWDLILNKLKEGMLDACGLTLSDLTTIKDSFINTLMGHYHSRIEYPSGEKDNE